MIEVNFKGNPATTCGDMPLKNETAPAFTLVNASLEDKKLENYLGQKLVLNIFPSIDTGVCAASVKKFNEHATSLANTKVLNISQDLPFALGRFCAAEGIENVETLSAFRSTFGEDYGILLTSSPLEGLLTRSVVVINDEGKITYTEIVNEITEEPDYQSAINALKQ